MVHGNCKGNAAGGHPAQSTTSEQHHKSLVAPVCHEGFGITDIISQVIAKLSGNGSNVSTEVMEVRATLELLGSLQAFDH